MRAHREIVTFSTDSLAGRLFWRAVSFAVVLGTWEALGRWPVSVAFTPFTETAAAFFRMSVDGRFVKAYATTFEPLIIGVAICAVVGIACGVAMGLSRAFEWLALPVFIILQAAPMAAIIPLITYFYGIGVAAKVLAVVFLSAPVIVMNSYQGIRNTHPALLEMCRSFQGTRRQEIVKIMLPHARGLIFAGLRLGLAMGFIGVVVAELLITPTGIGDLITYHASVADYAEMLAAVVSIVVVAATAIALLERFERALFPGQAARP